MMMVCEETVWPLMVEIIGPNFLIIQRLDLVTLTTMMGVVQWEKCGSLHGLLLHSEFPPVLSQSRGTVCEWIIHRIWNC